MTFRHLEAFIAVARAGSVTLAAEELYLTQPTVSVQLKELEEELGVALFDRAGRGVTLTEAGKRLLAQASSVIEAREHLISEAASYRGLLTGKLEVHASNIPGDHLLPGLLGRFKSAHPGLRVVCRVADTAEVIERVAMGQAYLGVVGRTDKSSGLDFKPLWRDRLSLYGSPGFISAQGIDKGGITIAELARLPLLVREAGSASLGAVERALAAEGLSEGDINAVAELGSNAAVREALLEGVGAAFVSEVSVRLELSAGKLEKIEVAGLEPVTRHFYMVTDPSRSLPPSYVSFSEMLVKESGARPA